MASPMTRRIAVVGCGFVADLYMKSFELYADVSIVAAYDHNPERLAAFCRHWKIPAVASLRDIVDVRPDLVCNLTNPGSHFEVTHELLLAGLPVYSEKPLAMKMDDASRLNALAREKGVMLAGAPCSVLSDTAETLRQAVADETAGTVRLVYAELDDGFLPQAPYRDWVSVSGAPWPYDDEFRVGCTLEHAGYYLTWLVACFGPVKTVVASSAAVLPGKLQPDAGTPDFSVAVLHFQSGLVARLTCSIAAPHNHGLMLVGDRGNLEVAEAWDNAAPVRFRRRFVIRRRLMELPWASRINMRGPRQRQVKRNGAARMNFALGPVEMLHAMTGNRPCRTRSRLLSAR